MEPPEQRAGIMVLRAWLEGGRADDLRVRILATIGPDLTASTAVSAPEAVHEAVRIWLEELRNSPNDESTTP
ncbi:hypothetical protein [Paractinoplanes atraurantiacus]|uniref:hypothetical protein n=1 Tax=Paractinoplanes atraurantiacus TaxID=1036182 RepID=UPI000BE28869|nr:hypothetical protein [Actinoplanes atraurantiacus]